MPHNPGGLSHKRQNGQEAIAKHALGKTLDKIEPITAPEAA
jgi:hypothetical protein